jgi:two-component system response regulator HydG
MTSFAEEYCYLTMTAGARTGTSFLLDAGQPNRLGRGTDCEIVLVDPNCSRVHAQIERVTDGWWVADQDSRNGIFVNDQQVSRARLQDGDRLRLGETVFTFYQTDEPPTLTTAREQIAVPTVIKQAQVDPGDSAQLLLALENAEFAHDLLMIYQLSVKLLEFDEPDPVIQTSIDLLFERTKASVVGFLWANDDGQLRPKFVLPDKGEDVSLNESLSSVVYQQGKAVWISNHASGQGAPLRRYSDAICVPLVKNRITMGVLHLYLKQGRFRQADFDFAISVANLMAVSLVRTRKEAALKADHQRLADDVADANELIGVSPAMREVKSKIARIGPARGSVLIRGESGSGKELVARALHAESARGDRPMLSVNCAAIAADLIESQLFGHVKGAFTGAERDHEGWFQQADNGTLFLDEIGELPLAGQAKLLRILEGHPFLPVGATQEVSVDVRVIAATNRDLKDLVRQKRFRQDLYFRLSVFELELPPLRERGEDLERLLDHFFDHYRKRHGRPQLKLSAAARDRLLSYDWPGNVRQLRNVMDSAVLLANGEMIESDDLGLRSVPTGDRPTTLRIADWERMLILDALAKTRGKVPEAARLLGIGRATLYRKIDEYNIPR